MTRIKASCGQVIYGQTHIMCKMPKKKGNKTTGVSKPEPSSYAKDRLYSGRIIICRQCRAKVTMSGYKISISGSYTHTFVNPHGLLFEITCFKAAEGCLTAGKPTEEFTWFPGHTWQVALCRKCLIHLGWLFTGSHDFFFGLITDRIQESDEEHLEP